MSFNDKDIYVLAKGTTYYMYSSDSFVSCVNEGSKNLQKLDSSDIKTDTDFATRKESSDISTDTSIEKSLQCCDIKADTSKVGSKSCDTRSDTRKVNLPSNDTNADTSEQRTKETLSCIDTSKLEAYFDLKSIKDSDFKVKGGRGSTFLFIKDGRSLALRHYKRGGLIGKVNDDSYLKTSKYAHRAFDEFKLLQRLYKKGLHVPKPFLAREIHSLFTLKQDLITYQIEDSENLADILYKRALTDAEFGSISKELLKIFLEGVVHTDLNLRNILIDMKGQVFIIDFDKAILKDKLDSHDINDMCARLLRSFVKEEGKGLGQFFFDKDKFEAMQKNLLAQFLQKS